ncbi:hypothetical protein [Amaricoccus tamworthensis]|uniref:hypothetical protein n=1 Tax=Amaricoccus tamworthensis TaxID=57002 RepID=UPI003C7B62FA
MTNQPILVIGATGKTGSRVVTKLDTMGLPVRRGTRGSQTPFDWEDQSTWTPILTGVPDRVSSIGLEPGCCGTH